MVKYHEWWNYIFFWKGVGFAQISCQTFNKKCASVSLRRRESMQHPPVYRDSQQILQQHWHRCSTLFPKPIISYTNTPFHRLRSVFIFLKDNSPLSSAGWLTAVCSHASLSRSRSLSAAVAFGRPQSRSIRSDSRFRGVPRFRRCWCVEAHATQWGVGELAVLAVFLD